MTTEQVRNCLLRKMAVVETTRHLGARVEEVYETYQDLRILGLITWSPYSLVQERVRDTDFYPWRVIVLSCLMNRTHARQVRPVMGRLFDAWPGPLMMANAGGDLEEVIRPLGFYNQRAMSLRRMSIDYEHGVEPEKCRGVGEFGKDSLAVFVDERTNLDPKDGFLGKYVRWKRTGEVNFEYD